MLKSLFLFLGIAVFLIVLAPAQPGYQPYPPDDGFFATLSSVGIANQGGANPTPIRLPGSFSVKGGQPIGSRDNESVLPDLAPMWAPYSMYDITTGTATSQDRLVSCDDWRLIDPTPITGQRILIFTLGTANYGSGHLRTRRQLTPEGWVFYQTTAYLDEAGQCGAVEQPIAVVPTGQEGRWLPLASFTLYTVTENGGIGEPLVCQIARWCCPVSIRTCELDPPCALPCQGDCINAGSRDQSPRWLDQFILIEGIPSGL